MSLTTRVARACFVLAVLSPTLSADMIAPPSMPEQVAKADAVIVGKVTSIEKKRVEAILYPGAKQKFPMLVGVVKIEKPIKGVKNLTHVRVGFRAPFGKSRYPQATLQVGQEVCLFLTRHPEEPFFFMPMYFDMMRKEKNPMYAKNLSEVEKSARLLANSTKGLQSKNADDRFLTAAMLLTQYRTPKGQPPYKTETVPAEESTLILQALADANWQPQPGRFTMLTPMNLFNRLGVSQKDGFVRPKNFKEYPTVAKKWLRDNAGTFRIQKFVAKKK